MVTSEIIRIFNRMMYIKNAFQLEKSSNLLLMLSVFTDEDCDFYKFAVAKSDTESVQKFQSMLIDMFAGENKVTLAKVRSVVKKSFGKIGNLVSVNEDGNMDVPSLQVDENLMSTLISATTARTAVMSLGKIDTEDKNALSMNSIILMYGIVDITNLSAKDFRDRMSVNLHINDRVIGDYLVHLYDKSSITPTSDALADSTKLPNNVKVRVINGDDPDNAELIKQLMNGIEGDLPSYNEDVEEGTRKTKMIKVCKMIDQFVDVPTIPRDSVVEQVAALMSQTGNKLIALVGEHGCGLTYMGFLLNEYLNQRFENKYQNLHSKKIYSLNTEYLRTEVFKNNDGMLEFFSSINEFLEYNSGILFIDNFGSVFDVDKDGITEMSLLNMTDWSEPRTPTVIATMSIDDYSKYIEKSPILNEMFVKVQVPNMTDEEVKSCFKWRKSRFELDHFCKISDDMFSKAQKLAKKYIINMAAPKSVFRIIDIAGAIEMGNFEIPKEITDIERKYYEDKLLFVNEKMSSVDEPTCDIDKIYKDSEKITAKDELKLKKKIRDFKKNLRSEKKEISLASLQKAVSLITGVPEDSMSEDEVKKVSELKDNLMSEIIGQEEAVNVVCRTLKRRVIGLSANKTKTIGNLIFCGESGVGKTILAKKLAKYMFGDEKNMVRIDMSEFTEKYTMTKLIGTSAGFVGYENDGVLIKAIKEHKYCIVLLDEIEKAAQEIFNLFLQIFDDGRVTSGSGELVDCSNCMFILTSNVGAKKSQEMNGGIGFNKRDDYTESVYEKEIRKTFTPEFLNRIDNIVVFNHLSDDDMLKIVNLQLRQLSKTMVDAGRNIVYGDKVAEFIFEEAKKESNMGARPINRAIQNLIENPVADLLVDRYEEDIKTVKVSVEGDSLLIEKHTSEGEPMLFHFKEEKPKKRARKAKKTSEN